MRVIAGRLGGRNFNSPHGHRTHPMSDKVRGALFSVLGDIDGLSILDAFAGSGALSFEAISRGASHATAIEIDQRAQQTITANIRSLGLQAQIKPVKASISAWSDNNPEAQFDLILADPPYDDQQPKTIQQLSNHLKPNALLVLSWPGKQAEPPLTGLEIVSQKNYGDAQLVFYRRIS